MAWGLVLRLMQIVPGPFLEAQVILNKPFTNIDSSPFPPDIQDNDKLDLGWCRVSACRLCVCRAGLVSLESIVWEEDQDPPEFVQRSRLGADQDIDSAWDRK